MGSRRAGGAPTRVHDLRTAFGRDDALWRRRAEGFWLARSAARRFGFGMQWLSETLVRRKSGFQIAMLAACGIAALAALAIIYRVVFAHRLRVPGGRTRQPRLGLVDAFSLDGQRQLVLVRRDNVEHLVMIGGPNDVLVESQINRALAPDREAKRARRAGAAAPARRRPAAPVAPVRQVAGSRGLRRAGARRSPRRSGRRLRASDRVAGAAPPLAPEAPPLPRAPRRRATIAPPAAARAANRRRAGESRRRRPCAVPAAARSPDLCRPARRCRRR